MGLLAAKASSGLRGFHMMTKPVGPICNLDCTYCFYLEKEKLYPDHEKWRMQDNVLESYIRQYIESQDFPEVSFAWQGGEPTLLGVEFFRKVVALQKLYANGRKINNALQTNGTLLDDEWCEFLHDNDFLIGLSIDGPRELNDAYRVDKQQRPTFDAVVRGLQCLKKHKVEFNTLTVVNRLNSQQPLEVYRFLKQIGSGFMQFIPLVERMDNGGGFVQVKVRGYDLAEPPEPEGSAEQVMKRRSDGATEGSRPTTLSPPVTGWSVEARQYGEFLCTIFDEWVRRDVGRVFVQHFDVALGQWMGLGSSLCVFAEKCGAALAMEHNGDVYSCDHYVYPKYKLGNLMDQALGEIVASPQQRKFGSDKADSLPEYCRRCEVKFACNGECPKHRFARTPDGEEGLNYLCPSYKRFFNHIDPYMKRMTAHLKAGRPAAAIMRDLAEGFESDEATQRWSDEETGAIRERRHDGTAAGRERTGKPGRNDPCPCGSGMKYKRCCGR